MCSPAARTASQGAPRSAGKGVFPLPRVDHMPGETRPGGWRALREAGDSPTRRAEQSAGRPTRERSSGGLQGLLSDWVGQGSPKNPESTPGEKESALHTCWAQRTRNSHPLPLCSLHCSKLGVGWGWGGPPRGFPMALQIHRPGRPASTDCMHGPVCPATGYLEWRHRLLSPSPQGRHGLGPPLPKMVAPRVALATQLPSPDPSDFSVPLHLQVLGLSVLLSPARTLVNSPFMKRGSAFGFESHVLPVETLTDTEGKEERSQQCPPPLPHQRQAEPRDRRRLNFHWSLEL